MARITITVSELVYLRLREYARNEAGETISRAAADILADFLAEDDEVLDSQDNTWGRYRERIDDGESGAQFEQLIACSACGWMVYEMPDNNVCPACDCGGTLTKMSRGEAMEIKLKRLKENGREET